MKIEKRELSTLLRSYATRAFKDGNNVSLFYASEEEGYPCYAFYGDDFSKKEVVWESKGGCMSIIPVPHRENEFLAIVDFYLKVSPSKSKLIWGKKEDGQWVFKDMISIPYLHRFELIEIGKDIHFIGTTIADDKEFKEDWHLPGSIYTGILPKDFNEGLTVEKLATGYYRNHGLTKHFEKGHEVVYLSSDQGVIRVIPPYDTKKWTIEPVLDIPVSEIAIGDLDGDGFDEIITIEPFHGDTIRIFKLEDGMYKPIYTYDNITDFGHTLVFTKLRGTPTFLAGVRRKDCELVAFTWDKKINKHVIDTGGGPANLDVVNTHEYDLILASNHTENKAVVYIVR